MAALDFETDFAQMLGLWARAHLLSQDLVFFLSSHGLWVHYSVLPEAGPPRLAGGEGAEVQPAGHLSGAGNVPPAGRKCLPPLVCE